jgi:hypothetical protein
MFCGTRHINHVDSGKVPTLLNESDSQISSKKSYLLGNLNVLPNICALPCKGRNCARDVAEHMLEETVQILKLDTYEFMCPCFNVSI